MKPDYTASRLGPRHEFAIVLRLLQEQEASTHCRPTGTHFALCLFCPAIPEPPLGPWEPESLGVVQEMIQSSIYLWTWSEVDEHLQMHKHFDHAPDPAYHPKGWRSVRPQDLQHAVPGSAVIPDFHMEP